MDAEGCGRLSVYDGLMDVTLFCVCMLDCSLAAEMNASLIVVGAGASGPGDRWDCAEVV